MPWRQALIALLLALVQIVSSESMLLSFDKHDSELPRKLEVALEQSHYDCKIYFGIYNLERRDADHIAYIEAKDGGSFDYLIEGHGISSKRHKLSSKEDVLQLVLVHNKIFNMTDKLYVADCRDTP